MNEFQATAVMVALFALRCIVPLLLTMAVGILMNRLVDRWEAEERDTTPVEQGQPVGIPLPSLSMKAAEKAKASLPCWLVKGCDPARRSACPAFHQRGKACWVARLQAEGVLPSGCPDCPVYQTAHA